MQKVVPGLAAAAGAFVLWRLVTSKTKKTRLLNPPDYIIDVFFSELRKGTFEGLTRVPLMKRLNAVSRELYQARVLSLVDDPERRSELERVVFHSDMGGIEEFSDRFYTVLQSKSLQNTMCRYLVYLAMEHLPNAGFDRFERALVQGCCKISIIYDNYYFAWLKAVQDPVVTKFIEENPPPREFYNSYTIVNVDPETGTYSQLPFSARFADIFDGPDGLLSAFDQTIALLKNLVENDEQNTYIAFLQQYRNALAEKNIENLEPAWEELDRVWMDTKGPIQIVHDIETGYGDPLRSKATPDFSCRFLDDALKEANANISLIQAALMEYYKGRETELSRRGLKALSNTLAGIYYSPFKAGISLQFAFSGQSIPNRISVKTEKGVKIYFDEVETAARVELNKKFVKRIYHNGAQLLDKYKPNAVEQLVWHVAAHEVGHAIYGVSNVAAALPRPEIEPLLEEPRAELTAMFSLHLLYETKKISLENLEKYLLHFCLDALRYFNKWESEALQPYIIFQKYAYKTYFKHKYLSLNGAGQVVVDVGQTVAVLREMRSQFHRVLDLMDNNDGAALANVLAEFEQDDQILLQIKDQVKAC